MTPKNLRPRTWVVLAGAACLLGAGILGVRACRARGRAGGGASALFSGAGGPLDIGFTPRLEEGEGEGGGGLSLAKAPNAPKLLGTYGIALEPGQRAFLETNGFVLLPLAGSGLAGTACHDEMLHAFDQAGGSPIKEERSPENARLVTPDVLLHAFHRFFAMTQEELEKKELRDELDAFLQGLAGAAGRNAAAAPSALARGWRRIHAQMGVALVLLRNRKESAPGYFESPSQENAYLAADASADSLESAARLLDKAVPGLDPDSRARALQELALVYAASAVAPSPLFGAYDPAGRADYTQFAPRSHYAKSSELRAYFRAMMFLGRNGYPLKGEAGMGDALLLAGLFASRDAGGSLLADRWRRIMELTSLYAGSSDDLTYPEWTAFLKEAGGQAQPAPALAADPAFLARLRAAAGRLRQPRILADLPAEGAQPGRPLGERLLEATSFRVFGQRFSYDALVINRLANGGRYPVTALFVPAALGDARARAYAGAFVARDPRQGQAGGARVQRDLEALAGELAREPAEAWQASMGASWLRVLGTLTRSYGKGYPRYMRSEAFGDKQLMTFLGSYTELKHDTLLYARQCYAEAGEGSDAPVPPVVKGFVEPNLPFWNSLDELVRRTQAFFAGKGLFKGSVLLERLKEFEGQVGFLRDMAVKELKAEPLGDDEYERLRTLRLSYLAEPLNGIIDITEETGKTALIADIHTDARAGAVLYEGTGRPYLMLALVGNEASPRLTVGLAFSHWEFTEGLARRLNDEEWKQRVYATPPRLPAGNDWHRPLALK